MFLVAGLGNPGAEYSGSRHNIGFRLIEQLCSRLAVRMKTGRGHFLAGRTVYNDEKLILLQPTTFINNSGTALRQACDFFNVPPQNCLVCYDDLNLATGVLRIRRGGSAGGHNGVEDVIQKFGTDQFPRLRIGIGNDFREGEQVKYVLSRFNQQQASVIQEAVEKAADAVLEFVTNGSEAAMDKFN